MSQSLIMSRITASAVASALAALLDAALSAPAQAQTITFTDIANTNSSEFGSILFPPGVIRYGRFPSPTTGAGKGSTLPPMPAAL